MSIATKTGDTGQTALAGGRRLSKADPRVETYGVIDELNAVLGFARSLCRTPEIATATETIQRTLFRLGGALATDPDTPRPAARPAPAITPEDVDSLTTLVHKIEALDGILSDWSLPGAHTESAAYEMARTVCRRAERTLVRFHEDGNPIPSEILAYLNRLSDLLWLFGRLIERNAGIDARLRDDGHAGPKWSRAW